ncbi:MAG: hypothetical protein HYV36_07920 [Lentisphaerae bacterium]|nr:hypothetical protein [Lentisphaerota bacterium]
MVSRNEVRRFGQRLAKLFYPVGATDDTPGIRDAGMRMVNDVFELRVKAVVVHGCGEPRGNEHDRLFPASSPREVETPVDPVISPSIDDNESKAEAGPGQVREIAL